MLYVQQAIDNLSVETFFELPLVRQHRSLDVLDRALEEYPYLLSLPTLHQRLAALWRVGITQEDRDEILHHKVKEVLSNTQIVMESLGMKPPLIAIFDPAFAIVKTGVMTTQTTN
jgi:hypothetical protein